jgi:hypothetical protein
MIKNERFNKVKSLEVTVVVAIFCSSCFDLCQFELSSDLRKKIIAKYRERIYAFKVLDTILSY